MNSLVCIKQVPDTQDIGIDPVTGRMLRDGVQGIVNPYDLLALETALRLREAGHGGRVSVLSMGPPQAEEALKECLSLGADAAYLACDAAFAGSDTFATSLVLAGAVAKIEETGGAFDLILCGKQSLDGETAQVGPQIAEHLGLPQITGAVEVAVTGREVRARQETGTGWNVVAAPLPCLVTVADAGFTPRYPTIRSILDASRRAVPVLDAASLGIDPARAGLSGSPTRISRTFAPVSGKKGLMLDEGNLEETVARLCALLRDRRPA